MVNNLNIKKKVLTIFLDLAKAFDTVPSPALLLKLESIGVRGRQLELFASYLSNRSQVVKIQNYLSEELPIHYGVPQGSILGPTVFLIFINDLCNLKIPNGSIITYADDTAITVSSDSWDQLHSEAQQSFDLVFRWLRSHTLTLNISKTKFIPFSLRINSQPKKLHNYQSSFLHTAK